MLKLPRVSQTKVGHNAATPAGQLVMLLDNSEDRAIWWMGRGGKRGSRC